MQGYPTQKIVSVTQDVTIYLIFGEACLSWETMTERHYNLTLLQ